MRALLDVNVLIALLDSDHVFHEKATKWLKVEVRNGWASCPITQNGCIRIMSNPNYPGSFSAPQVAERLSEAVNHSSHEFWADSISLLEPDRLDWSLVSGHKQLTDIYLLALALNNGGRLATFDRNIIYGGVQGAKKCHVAVIE